MNRTDRANRETGGGIRTFVCVEVPAAIRTRIESLQRDLRRNDVPISWVKPANIHLTIKFLGDVPAARVDDVRRAVERACQPVPPFEITVEGAGCFPSARSPRVLWVGLNPLPDELRRLHSNVEAELERLGFAREAKRFSPHLTIARVRDPFKARPTVDGLMATGFAAEAFGVAEVIVMRSDLHPSGSIYTPQAVVKLSANVEA
ncbi:MAG TPA: RNA 2',3'-cyclic phosphodiesterase [Blastocatellia bacterium]|nr:RNA 2',3'-cyclic phosphodiesterase [Blastocatellia bacterium]